MRESIEAHERRYLSPLAVLSSESRGRDHREPLDDTRTCFQKDRDRIIHSNAFRRLKNKTQVFVSTEHDHVRSRLTHSIEVSHVARHMSRLLQLNDDLSEAIALAHDLGHPPYGHAGETTLNHRMRHEGGFEHNQQSWRIVNKLESKYPHFQGLNLSFEVCQGLLKHRDDADGFVSLEAQVVDLADEITYVAHDIDDALRAGIITNDQLLDHAAIWRRHHKTMTQTYSNLTNKQSAYLMNSALITDQITNAMTHTSDTLASLNVASLSSLQAHVEMPIVQFSSHYANEIRELRQFLFDHYYSHHIIYRSIRNGQAMIHALFDIYQADPRLIPREFYEAIADTPDERIICDYISGMTDSFLVTEYNQLMPLGALN